MTDFMNDIKTGKVGEDIFVNDFLRFLNIKYKDVTNCQQFQIIDSDFLTKIGTYEIKTNYRDDEKIVIEEYTNYNKSLGKESLGWFYKSKADLLVFISKATRVMIFIPFTDRFKDFYESIKQNHKLILNQISCKGSSQWQSAFRFIPLSQLTGYYSKYKRVL
jgi:hypothetical protein